MSDVPDSKVPENARSTLASMNRSEEKKEPYGLLSRLVMFIAVLGFVTAIFGYGFVQYGMGAGMTAGAGNPSDRTWGTLIVFGYPAVVAWAAWGIFKK